MASLGERNSQFMTLLISKFGFNCLITPVQLLVMNRFSGLTLLRMAILLKVEKSLEKLASACKSAKGVSTLQKALVLGGFCRVFELSHNLEVVGSNPAPATSLFG